MPTIGDTITLHAEFRTWDGVLADPAGVMLQFYDSLKKTIGEPISVDDKKISVGVYEYNYVVPAGEGALYYEWSGNLETSPVVARGVINRRWIGG